MRIFLLFSVLALLLAERAAAQSLPAITTQPRGQTVNVGASLTLTVVATGAPLTYQWRFNGSPIAGATNANYTLSSVAGTDAGMYSVVATNSAGSTTSGSANLIVYIPYSVTTTAGQALSTGASDGTGSAAKFNFPQGIATDSSGNIYVADTINSVIRKITPAGVVTTFAGQAGVTGSADATIGTSAQFYFPSGLAVDSAGTVYVADTFNSTIRKITSAGAVTTLAGTPATASNPNNAGSANGTGAAARFYFPRGIAVDGTGTVYVADTYNYTIRKITPAGVVTTLAGLAGNNGTTDGTGAAARFNDPYGIASDASGNLWVADTGNSTVRAITPGGIVTTLAGLGGNAGTTGGIGSAARFNFPSAIAVDGAGNAYVADMNTDLVREITSAGVVVTLAGLIGNTGAVDAAGSSARFNLPFGVAVDGAGNLYVADTDNATIRKATAPPTNPALAPQIQAQPQSQAAVTGGSATLSVTATGTGLSYQWLYNGVVIPGATASTLTLTNVGTTQRGAYSVMIANSSGSVTSSAAALTVNSSARLVNLSARANVSAGGNIAAGFVTGGSGSKKMLFRGIGPGLIPFGVTSALPDPSLALLSSTGATLSTNAGWGGTAALTQLFSQLGAFALPPASADAALSTTVPIGKYTERVSSVTASSGIALVEIYDADPSTSTGRLVNISTLAAVGVGANALSAGFVVSGTTSETVLVRGIGPGLSTFGVQGVLAQPSIVIQDQAQNIIASNSGWGGSAALAGVFAQVGAFALSSTSADAALVVTLPPGPYTAQLTGVNGTTGTAIVEVYEVP